MDMIIKVIGYILAASLVCASGAAKASEQDPSKRPAGISDAELERRMKALAAHEANKAEETRKRAEEEKAREEERERRRREAEEKEREEKEKKRSADEPPPEPEDDVTDLKFRYYEQQITLAKHEDKYLDVCKHYRQVCILAPAFTLIALRPPAFTLNCT